MNELKVCFVINKSSQNLKQQIEELNVPENYTIEIIEKNMSNVCKAYNEAMASSNAKYKIYIYDDIEINNKDVIEDILNLFNISQDLGLIGIYGSKTIPTSGNWQDSIHKFKGDLSELEENEKLEQIKYTEVKAVGRSFIATQYDSYWREDIFDDKYFYEVSQCIEFEKKGYKNIIPIQKKSWVAEQDDFYEVEKNNEFEKYRNIFLFEYSKDIFPLVSILIPTYNRPNYFKIALESAINQTYKNIEIIICDDSTNNETSVLMKKYLDEYDNIKYYNNNGPLGQKGLLNVIKCFEKSKGEYINYLLDDDVFHPEKINRMMNYYIEYENIKIVTSERERINGEGIILPKQSYNLRLFSLDTVVDGSVIAEYILNTEMNNVIGELTTVLLRREDVVNSICKCFNYQCKSLGDLGMWMELLSKGKIVYISEALSYFRIHDDRNTNDAEINLHCIIDYYNIISQVCNRNLYIKNVNDYSKVFIKYNRNSINLLKDLNLSKISLDLRQNVYECLSDSINYILNIKEK